MTSTGARVQTAVVTGRHPFDVRGFHALFRSMGDIDYFPQHMEDFAADPRRAEYDVVVFYHFHQETPREDAPWYEAGIRPAMESLGETGQGILVLHHAILAFPDWDYWADLVGIRDRSFGYHIGETLTVDVAPIDHPITRGLSSWEMIDETYSMASAGPGSEALLTTEHERSMRALAWTRTHRNSRVFCLESGHDNDTFTNESFRTVLSRGIQWLAGRLD